MQALVCASNKVEQKAPGFSNTQKVEFLLSPLLRSACSQKNQKIKKIQNIKPLKRTLNP